MRKLLIVVLLGAVLGACGGSSPRAAGGGDETNAPLPGTGSDFCNLASSLDEFDVPEFDPSDLSSMQAFYQELVNAMDTAVAAAPSEIKADMELIAGGMRQLIDALGNADPNDPASFAAAFQGLSTEEFTAAGERMEAYFERECGIDPSE